MFLFVKSVKLLLFLWKKNKVNVEVFFTGGLGNQMMSLMALKYLNKIGLKTSVNLEYFDNLDLRKILNSRNLSTYDWELEDYLGIKKDSLNFNGKPNSKIKKFQLKDGIIKLFLALEGSKDKNILSSIEFCCNDPNILLESNLLEPYICVHVRRGDYLNVASFILPIQTSFSLVKRFLNICKTVVILSDGQISAENVNYLYSIGFERVKVISSGSPIKAHTIMRNSKILITSNSQFSYSAALVSNSICFIPKKWYGGFKHFMLQKLLLSRSQEFIIL